MKDLESKTQNEKYYKSIRYLSHSLSGESRQNFIKLVSEYNSYLAAQCAMTCEKDQLLEEQLSEKAIEDSKEIAEDKKIIGLLGLIELNRYDKISEVFSNVEKNIKMYRRVIKRIINEIDTENIIKFLKIIVNTNIKWLVSSVITAVYNREINITNEQFKEVEAIYEKLKEIYQFDDYRILRFHLAFKLPKRLLPQKLDIVAKKNIRRGGIDLVKELYSNYDIEFTYSEYDICNILLTKNKQFSVLAFASSFFKIREVDKQLELLRVAINKGRYLSGFCLSLLRDKKKREFYVSKFDNPEDILIKADFFVSKKYPRFDQSLIEQLIRNELKKKLIEGY